MAAAASVLEFIMEGCSWKDRSDFFWFCFLVLVNYVFLHSFTNFPVVCIVRNRSDRETDYESDLLEMNLYCPLNDHSVRSSSGAILFTKQSSVG